MLHKSFKLHLHLDRFFSPTLLTKAKVQTFFKHVLRALVRFFLKPIMVFQLFSVKRAHAE